ncbi:MAG: hypothetical protein D6705_13745 [Deltaproteobacteria bacterium]|nr:MAG: hypothetical protein D6705_13745 [Deltaproteobacteria bacterium]
MHLEFARTPLLCAYLLLMPTACGDDSSGGGADTEGATGGSSSSSGTGTSTGNSTSGTSSSSSAGSTGDTGTGTGSTGTGDTGTGGSTGGACAPGETPCDGGCVDTQTDAAHCGGCGNLCGPGGWTCDMGTCAESRAWQTPVAISGAVEGSRPQAAADDAGNATVVWTENFAGWTARYDGAMEQWGAAEVLAAQISSPPVADLQRASGAGIAAWRLISANGKAVRAATFDGSWGMASDVMSIPMNATGQIGTVHTAAGGDRMTVAWLGSIDGNPLRLRASVNDDGMGWGAPVLLDWEGASWGEPDDTNFALDVGPSGFVIAVWPQWNVDMARMVLNANGLGGPEIISSLPGNASRPDIAIDGQDRAIATWEQVEQGGSVHRVFVTRYAGGWSAPLELSANPNGVALAPKVAVGPAGDAMVVYAEVDAGMNVTNLWAHRFDPQSETWAPAMLLDQAGDDINAWSVAVDAAGNAGVLWTRRDANTDPYDVVARRYARVADAWGMVAAVESSPEPANFPELAVDGAGNLLATWEQSSGSNYQVYVSWYR